MNIKNILHIDDEYTIRKNINRYLTHKNYNVISKENTEQGLEAYNNGYDIDLLITDLNAPDKHAGMDLIKKIRAEDRSTPIILLSGSLDSKIKKKAQEQDVYVLSKPLDFDSLDYAIKEYKKN